jgi:hypothetical protein
MPARRLSFARGFVFSLGAGGRTRAHFVLGKDESLRLAGFVAPLQNASAQKRQFLYLDAVSAYQGEIGSHRECRPDAIHGYAFECKHAASQILLEARQNELHLGAPSRTSLQLPGGT